MEAINRRIQFEEETGIDINHAIYNVQGSDYPDPDCVSEVFRYLDWIEKRESELSWLLKKAEPQWAMLDIFHFDGKST